MKKDFETWFHSFTETIASWNYYVNFPKVSQNVDLIKEQLEILNSLSNSNDLEQDFKDIIIKYPETLKVLPILLAKRDTKITINDNEENKVYDFSEFNMSIDDYSEFMHKSGLFEILENKLITNIKDFVTGIEVGMDTNGRKNRTGILMEELVEKQLQKAGLHKNVSYFQQMSVKEIEYKWNLNLNILEEVNALDKRFDFVVELNNKLYAIECNFYNSGGSKLNEVARSYKAINQKLSTTPMQFIWITDGKGWESVKHALKDSYESIKYLVNLYDLKEGFFTKLQNKTT
ncbi:type II restriction endonuclease [Mycoplasmopsis columboralis]|uniref:Type-2 restriction enzyme n=1 Tax=Mycoplasmopsis columboralis TaxID=171282 RepID=A0A449B648_9BACT|nr:type II restriction endonuclease [Mycoplasmopsis columboralis]VEU76042.1 Type-2 restriction enzyme DpnII [Mycoplasmopsis columboralis]